MKRVGVVGVGPKGLFSLERLAIEMQSVDPAEIAGVEVHLFEPHGHPGAGSVYDPTQPAYLRMNFANGMVNLWSDPALGQPNLVEWLHHHHPSAADPAGYAPRALVGEYLSSGFEAVVDLLHRSVSVKLHRRPVLEIQDHDGRWRVHDGHKSYEIDELLIATGHDSRTHTPHPEAIGPVYPVDRLDGIGSIPPASRVAVRGFGLTSLDAVLALTEGRGGTFLSGSRPGEISFVPNERDRPLILPYSRSGRPMVPKPDLRHFESRDGLDDVWRIGRERLGLLPGDGSVIVRSIRRVLINAARAALSRWEHCDHDAAVDYVGGYVRSLFRTSRPPGSIMADMQRSLDVAYGRRPPDAEWAIGEAWRNLYPVIVDLVGARRLDTAWAEFSELAIQMERVAFGPPAENAARLHTLVKSGIVDVSWARNPTVWKTNQGVALLAKGRSIEADVLIDAVLAPPGAAPNGSSLMRSLLDQGFVRTMPSNGGIEVLSDGTCVGRSGVPMRGLAMVGRPTEGCTLGNDTLSRTLHDTPGQWARSVMTRLLKRSAVNA